MIVGALIVYHNYETILQPIHLTKGEIAKITLVVAGSISQHRAFGVWKVAKKHNLVSLNLDAKKLYQGWQCFICWICIVLVGYFGKPYIDAFGSIIIAGSTFQISY